MPTLESVWTLPYRILRRPLELLPCFRFDRETRFTQTPATIEAWISQNVFGRNRGPYWPVHPSSCVIGWRSILVGIETSPGLMPGCYIQGIGTIQIGDYTQVASNVGIISANHDLHDSRVHHAERVEIGSYCWIGMGAVVLPGVTLGDFTVVGANAVVTKSFPDGHCVVAGNPAKKIRELDRSKCRRYTSPHEYHGFIRKDRFPEYRARYLHV